MQLLGSYKNQPFKPPIKSTGNKRAVPVKVAPKKFAPSSTKSTLQRVPKKSAPSANEGASQTHVHDSQKKYCYLMYRKYTTKTHKTWDGDAYGVYVMPTNTLKIYTIDGKYLGSKSLTSELDDDLIVSFHSLEYQLDYFIEPSMQEDYQKIRETIFKKASTANQSVAQDKRLMAPEVTVPANLPEVPKPKKARVSSSFQFPMIVKPLKSVPNDALAKTSTEPNQLKNKPNCFYDLSEITNPLIMNKIKDGDREEIQADIAVDPLISNLLRPHQREGVKFMYDCIMGVKSSEISGCLLADEMGLGKTLMTITVIWTLLKQTPFPKQISQKKMISLNGEIKKIVIVCPVTLIGNWKKEFKKWIRLQKIGVMTLNDPKNGTDKDKRDFQNFLKVQRTYQVIIISYEKTISLQSVLNDSDLNQYVDLLICDEAHRLKNNSSKILQILKNCDFKKKILLTGTPIQNDLNEFFTIIDFLNPGIMGSLNSFKKNYITPISRAREMSNKGSDKILDIGNERSNELIEITSQFILRRTNDILNKYLPTKTDYIVFCKPTAVQLEVSQKVLTENNINWNKMSFNSSLGLITLFKKISNSPDLIHTDSFYQQGSFSKIQTGFSRTISQNSGKLRMLHQLLKNIVHISDDKIVIISNYTKTLDIIESVLQMENLTFVRLDGSTPTKTRDQLVQNFNTNPSTRCFLLSAKSGGVGLNLIGGNRLILFDNDWNPAIDAQAMGRIHRDGQKKKCYIYRLVTTGFIDEKILQRQLMKINLSKQILNDSDNANDEDADASDSSTTKKTQHNSNIFEQADLKDLFTIRTETKSNTHDLICDCVGDAQCSGKNDDVNGDELTKQKVELGFIKASQAQESLDLEAKKKEFANKEVIKQCLKGYKHIDPLLKAKDGTFFRYILKDDALRSFSDDAISFILEK